MGVVVLESTAPALRVARLLGFRGAYVVATTRLEMRAAVAVARLLGGLVAPEALVRLRGVGKTVSVRRRPHTAQAAVGGQGRLT